MQHMEIKKKSSYYFDESHRRVEPKNTSPDSAAEDACEAHNHFWSRLSCQMDKIRVDHESGQVVLLEVLNLAIPGLHRQGTSRLLRKVLEKYDGTPPTKLRINSSGNPNIVGTLEACLYLLDHFPGWKWDKWRNESAVEFQEFKNNLTKHVSNSCTSPERTSPEPKSTTSPTFTPITTLMKTGESDDESEDEVFTASELLQKHLQAANIFGRVRVNEESKMVSVIDIIQLMCPGVDPSYAGRMLTRLVEEIDGGTVSGEKVTGESPSDLRSRITSIKINGKGHATPVTDAKTIVEIMWMLPSKAARAFRRKSAGIICQVLGGDMSLCDEIEERHHRLESSDEGRRFKEFMTEENSAKKPRFGPSWLELASVEQKEAYVSTEVNKSLAEGEKNIAEAKKSTFFTEMERTKSYIEALKMIGHFDDRDKLEVADRIKDYHRRIDGSQVGSQLPTIQAPTSTETSIQTAHSSSQLQRSNTIDPSTGLRLATPKCPLNVRGSETSIPLEAGKLNVRVGDRSGPVGKEIKRLYGIRYGADAARDIPKRTTIFRGKPFNENTYYIRDSDLIQRAICNICGS